MGPHRREVVTGAAGFGARAALRLQTLAFPSRRSIVAADIPHSFAACASSRSGSPQARSRPTICYRNGAHRPCPPGRPSPPTPCTTRASRPRRTPEPQPCEAPAPGAARAPSRNALRAWLRCHPVSSHSSSSTLAQTARDDDRYRVAVAFVTTLGGPIVSPMSEAGRAPTGNAAATP
jgi:hypothetical protein